MSSFFKIFLCMSAAGALQASFSSLSSGNDDSPHDQPVDLYNETQLYSPLSKNKFNNVRLACRQVEEELANFERKVSQRSLETHKKYQEIAYHESFLTDEDYVEKYIRKFEEDLLKTKQQEEEEFNTLSKKISSLRDICGSSNLVASSTNALMGSLQNIAREHGFREYQSQRTTPLKVPSLKLDTITSHAPNSIAAEGQIENWIQDSCVVAGVRAVNSISQVSSFRAHQGDDDTVQETIVNQRMTLGEDFVETKNMVESEHGDSDNDSDHISEIISKEDLLGDNCPNISRKESM